MANVVYTSTNTSSQAIDTFDLPTEKVINYKVHVTAGNTTWYSLLDVSHNGIQASEQQTALAQTGITPLEFVVSIANNSGTVNVTPTVIPTTFSIERLATLCNLYSENTLSGRNIQTEEGLGIYFNSANNITIRQSNNNVFAYANAYITSGVMGPIKTKSNILSEWTAANGSIRTIDGDYQVAISSGQKDNCQTQEIAVSPGKRYILTGNAYYTTDQNYSHTLEDRDTGPSRIEIGTRFGDNDYGGYIANTSDNAFSIVFSPTSNSAHVSFGFGDINNRLFVKNIELKEYVPFHTYNQDEGAIYIKWDAVAAGNTILSLNSNNANNRIYVDSSNNIFVNTTNCGSQQVTNKIVLNYNANGINISRNGNSIITASETFNKYIANAVFVSTPYEFAYMSSNISNTVMVALSNV
jgi:hypothetical protein